MTRRDALAYEIDGVVIKVDDIAAQETRLCCTSASLGYSLQVPQLKKRSLCLMMLSFRLPHRSHYACSEAGTYFCWWCDGK